MVSLILVSLITIFMGFSEGQLEVGFYAKTCPSAELTVRHVVRNSIISNPTMAAVLLRLHFHDCFVEGCDGSILIENGPNGERHAFGHQGVGGFEVIEKAKEELESECRGVVSCADIVALAAREAIVMAGGPEYEVPTGRKDGQISNISLADDMPEVGDSIRTLKNKFLVKGLSDQDLVLLTAAHTIGTTACFFMTKRLYDFFPGGGSDPSINHRLLPKLKKACPQNGDVNVRLAMDRGSERTFDKHILQNIKTGFAVLASDARLNDDMSTKAILDSYFSLLTPIFGPSFEVDFVTSIVKMGQIGVKKEIDGNIRQVCSTLN